MITVYIREELPESRQIGSADYRYHLANVSCEFSRRYDNGRLCGLTVPDDVPRKVFARLTDTEEITRNQWAHSSCLSSCINRGDADCSW